MVIGRSQTATADVTFIGDQTTFAFTVYGTLLFGADSPTGVTLRVEGDVNATDHFADLLLSTWNKKQLAEWLQRVGFAGPDRPTLGPCRHTHRHR